MYMIQVVRETSKNGVFGDFCKFFYYLHFLEPGCCDYPGCGWGETSKWQVGIATVIERVLQINMKDEEFITSVRAFPRSFL